METSVIAVYLFHAVYHITLKFIISISPNFTNMSFLIQIFYHLQKQHFLLDYYLPVSLPLIISILLQNLHFPSPKPCLYKFVLAALFFYKILTSSSPASAYICFLLQFSSSARTALSPRLPFFCICFFQHLSSSLAYAL